LFLCKRKKISMGLKFLFTQMQMLLIIREKENPAWIVKGLFA